MADLTKPAFIVLSINIMLVVGGIQILDAGVVGDFVDITQSDSDQYYSYDADRTRIDGVSSELNNSLPQDQQSFIQDPVGQTLSLFDNIGLIKDAILLLFNIVLAPIGILTAAGVPGIAKVFIGLPLLFFNTMGMVSFIRGVA